MRETASLHPAAIWGTSFEKRRADRRLSHLKLQHVAAHWTTASWKAPTNTSDTVCSTARWFVLRAARMSPRSCTAIRKLSLTRFVSSVWSHGPRSAEDGEFSTARGLAGLWPVLSHHREKYQALAYGGRGLRHGQAGRA